MTHPSKHIKSIFKKTAIVLVSFIALFFLLDLIFPLHDKIEYSTIITDDNGEVIHAYLTSDDKWRMKTELEEISPLLKQTIIAKEDKYFYSHPGINPFAIGRAFLKNISRMKRTSGASTITMQVARALEPRKRNFSSKVIEMFRAFQLEMKYSKNEILQMYLNLVPYGGNIEGVKSASLLYFNKDPNHLSLAEITALSIIPNRPSSLVIGKNNSLILQERNRWLKKFAKDHLFTPKQIEDALQEPLLATRGTVPSYLPHLSYKLKRQTPDDIIKTNIHLNTQLKIEKLVADYVRVLRLQNIKNAAVVVINNKTNKVISYAGSADFYDTTDGGQVNGAAAIRQPGSTLKPLLYALCIDNGLMTPKTVTTDVAVSYDGYSPENYNQHFNGYVTMEYALEHSLNIPAVKSLKQLGKDELINKLSACNFRQVKKDRNKLGLSMILGGCGATLEELTGMYAAFSHEGIYTAPSYLQKDTGTRKKTTIMSPAAAFMITEILSKVNRPDFPLNWQATEHMPKIAWKTGTSYGRRDAWSIGYNKNFTVGVWVGNFSGTGVAGLSGAEIATPLLFKIFNTIDYNNDGEWFSPPADIALRQVCGETGMVPGPFCNNKILDQFIPLISSTAICNNTAEIMISPDEKISYCKSCAPLNGYKKKRYKIISADMQQYFSEKNIAFEKIPGHNPGCEKIFKENAPVVTSPANGSEYLVSKKNPEPIMLFCKTPNDVSRVYWYIDNKFFKTAGSGERQFFSPKEGPVKISCTDDKGRNTDIWITVRFVNL